MSKQDAFWFGIVGAVVWTAATLFYAAFARGVIEQAFWFYALNAALVAAATAMFFHLTARLRHLPKRMRITAALVYAAPGLAGAAALLLNFAKFLPHLPPASLGRYGALVLVAYALLITLAAEKPVKRA